MPTIGPLGPTSQLAAINTCLSAIGEAPIEDEVSSTRADVALAASLLSEASQEVQMQGWRFNREFGYELAPSGQVLWTTAEGSTTLNIFLPPANLARWTLSPIVEQANLSLILRLPRRYGGSAPRGVFYDRYLNRDGLDASKYPALYIDPVFYVEWDQLPETARQHIVMKAARKFAARTVGATDLVGFTREDELRTLVNLNEDQVLEDEFNIFDSYDVSRIYGGRNLGATGYLHDRNSPRPI